MSRKPTTTRRRAANPAKLAHAPSATRRPEPLCVTLPTHDSIPADYRGADYWLASLLTDGDTNAKLRKSNGVGSTYRTFGLSLAPGRESGYQLCASASAGCLRACLFTAGRGAFDSTRVARVARAVALMEHREWFSRMLRWELTAATTRAEREGFVPAVRLNVVSDVMWERVFPWLHESFPAVQFYDYTKHITRAMAHATGAFSSNYHITFSRSESNEPAALEVLRAGGNVAVVFATDELPETWHGFKVVNGDETDLRFLDPAGSVVGLKAKGAARRDASGFVVQPGGRVALPLA